jgi:DNA-binding transcriptional LysR family regulator
LNLNWLATLHAVASTGSFSAAASLLGLSQPAVSLQMKQLEQEAGVKLFVRRGRKMVMLPAAGALRDHARLAFSLGRRAVEILQDYREARHGQLRLGASLTVGTSHLPRLIRQFANRFPSVRVHLTMGNSEQIMARVREHVDELGFVARWTTESVLQVEPLFEDRVVLVTAPHGPLGGRRAIGIQALGSVPLILREPGSMTREMVERFLEHWHVRPNVTMELGSNDVIRELVMVGLGVSFMSREAVRKDLKEGNLRLVRIREGTLTRTFHAVWRNEWPLTPAAQVFLELARQSRPVNRRLSSQLGPPAVSDACKLTQGDARKLTHPP